MPLRVSKPHGLHSASSKQFAMNPSSLAALNKTAASPPPQLRRVAVPVPAVVLYIFRVPGRQDFCFSLSKPLEDVITDIDVSTALFYARCDDEPTGRFTILRRDPARNQTIEVAMAVETASHVDVFGKKYGCIEETYWRMNGNEIMTAKSNFGCYIWHEPGSSSFLSPWTGRCVFRPAKGGHSLRCMYLFPRFSPDDDAELSELRFNFSGQKRAVNTQLQQSSDTNAAEGSFDGTKTASRASISGSPTSTSGEFIPRRHQFLHRLSEFNPDDPTSKRAAVFKPIQTKIRARSNSADHRVDRAGNVDASHRSETMASSVGSYAKLYGPRPLEPTTNIARSFDAISTSTAPTASSDTERPKIPRRPVQSEACSRPASVAMLQTTAQAISVDLTPTVESPNSAAKLSSFSIRRKQIGSGDSSESRHNIATGDPDQAPNNILGNPIQSEPESGLDTLRADNQAQVVNSQAELPSIEELGETSVIGPPKLPPRSERRPDPNLLFPGPEKKTHVTPSSENPTISSPAIAVSLEQPSTKATEEREGKPPALPPRNATGEIKEEQEDEEASIRTEHPPELPPRSTPENQGYDEQLPDLPPRKATLSDSSMDISLGREKLGGGSDGEQAKLGKLIVSSEGQQMLDLIVVANVLMFYRAYKAANLAICEP